jgi:hypothetical protein
MTNYQVFIERIAGSVKYKVAAYLEIQAVNEDEVFSSTQVQHEIDKCYGRNFRVTIHEEEHPKTVFTWEVQKVRRRYTKRMRVEALGHE